MSRMFGKKLIFMLIGILATVVGIVGVWLPGVPTTGPILLAMWAFGKSSSRLEAWLKRLPILRTALKEAKHYEQHKTVSRSSKLISQLSAWGSTVLLAVFLQNVVVTVIVGSLALMCTIFMIRTPTKGSEQLLPTEVPFASE